SAVAKAPRLPDARDGALPLPSEAPLPIWVNTCWTTLRIKSSVICMADTVALLSLTCRSLSCRVGGTHRIPRPRIGGFHPPYETDLPGILPRREDHPAADVHGVDQPDYHRIDWELLGLGRQSRTRALADQDHLVDARAQRVDHDERAPGRHEPAPLLLV